MKRLLLLLLVTMGCTTEGNIAPEMHKSLLPASDAKELYDTYNKHFKDPIENEEVLKNLQHLSSEIEYVAAHGGRYYVVSAPTMAYMTAPDKLISELKKLGYKGFLTNERKYGQYCDMRKSNIPTAKCLVIEW